MYCETLQTNNTPTTLQTYKNCFVMDNRSAVAGCNGFGTKTANINHHQPVHHNVPPRRLVSATASMPLNVGLNQTSSAIPIPNLHKSLSGVTITPNGLHNASITLVRGLSVNAASIMNNNNNNVINNNNNENKNHKKLDRSYSEPAEKNHQQQQQATRSKSTGSAGVAGPMSSRYKTELCRSFAEVGTCKYGDKCQFAHGNHELRVISRHPKFKTENCKSFHSTGFCPYGPRCHFIHNSDESKKNMFNNLGSSDNVGSRMSQNRSIQVTNGNNANINSSGSIEKAFSSSTPCPPTATILPMRPTALSIGSYSLGSSGEISPPSSIGSPKSFNAFFDELFNGFEQGGDNYEVPVMNGTRY